MFRLQSSSKVTNSDTVVRSHVIYISLMFTIGAQKACFLWLCGSSWFGKKYLNTETVNLCPFNTFYLSTNKFSDVFNSLILKYSGLRSTFGQQRCTRWALLNSSDVDTTSDLIYQQRCDSGMAVATHSLRLNSDRQLLALRFTFHPARPPAIIRYMGN